MKKKTFEVNGHTFRTGDEVTAQVPFPNNRRVTMTGTLITVDGEEAYLNTSIGPVAADVSTLEPA